jgi:hypothetical protein
MNKLPMLGLALLLPALAVLPAWGQVSLLRMSGAELAAARGDRITYTVRTTQPGSLALEILSGDGDVVRRIVPGSVPAGEHALAWDGRDERGQPVPDEAYCARATLEAGGSQASDDPCARTGGEVLAGIQPSIAPSGDIAYTLEHPSRVLIRVGVKNGAMLRSLSVWRPRPAGRNLQRWNGFDESGLVDLRTDRLALLVAAFRLPEFTVITTGQDGLEYRAWRLAQGWPEKPDGPQDAAVRPLERNGQRIARQHYMARYKDREPRITVALATRDGKPLPGGATLPDEVRVAVDLHPEDRWLMQEQLYEVGFFVNGEFVSEEENGYVPIGWIWNTAGLRPGRHLLTVNLTGFTGRVGTRTIAVQK